jgi:hypothetical protein
MLETGFRGPCRGATWYRSKKRYNQPLGPLVVGQSFWTSDVIDRSRLQSDSELKDLAYADGASEFLVGGRALNQVTSLFDLLNLFRDTILLPTSVGASPGKVAKDETHPAVVIRWNIAAGRAFGSA